MDLITYPVPIIFCAIIILSLIFGLDSLPAFIFIGSIFIVILFLVSENSSSESG